MNDIASDPQAQTATQGVQPAQPVVPPAPVDSPVSQTSTVPPVPQTPQTPPAPQAPPALDPDTQLSDFEQVLDEIQHSVPHGLVQAVDQATNTLNPAQASPRAAKERIDSGASAPDTRSVDMVDFAGSQSSIEQEKNPEIPVEVESFLQRVEDHHDTAPTEIVIADGSSQVPTNTYPSRPVVVLPITQQEEQEGAKKSPKFSFRWLVEFSHKVIKMFTGKVIYREEK